MPDRLVRAEKEQGVWLGCQLVEDHHYRVGSFDNVGLFPDGVVFVSAGGQVDQSWSVHHSVCRPVCGSFRCSVL